MQANKTTKKSIRQQVAHRLLEIEDLKTLLGKKKFQKRIKKVTKLLTADLPKNRENKKSAAIASEQIPTNTIETKIPDLTPAVNG